MKDYKGMDVSQYNNQYKEKMGVKCGKTMENHGNTTSIKVDNQKHDMNRVQRKGMESKGYSEKAFNYKY